MAKAAVFVLVLALLLAPSQRGIAETLASLIASNAEARGGKEAIESVVSLHLALEIHEPGFTVTANYRATRDGYMRIDVFSGSERVFTEALGPRGGWQLPRGESGAVDLSDGGADVLRRGLIGNLYGLHELAGLGYTLTMPGTGKRGHEHFWVIDQVAPGAFAKRRFIDKSSYLIVREVERSALHPDLDSTATEQETHYENFAVFAGVLMPTLSKKFDAATGDIIQSVVITKVEINPAMDLSQFDRPR